MKQLAIVALLTGMVWAEYVPSAQEQDKAAAFGYMIRRRRAEMTGVPMGELVRRSGYPWALAVGLLPVYAWCAAHRSRSRSAA